MVSVSGAALTRYNRRKESSGFRDWAAEAFTAALAMADIEARDLDALIVASESDFFSLQLNPATVIANDLGLCDIACSRVEGGGASGQLAVHAGTQAILSGLARHVAIIGVDPSASQLPASTIKELYSYSFDAWFDGMSGASSTILYALSMQGFMARKQVTDNDLSLVTCQNRRNACHNPNAHLRLRHEVEDINDSPLIASPYRRLHCSPLSDGAAAVILSTPKYLPATRALAPRVAGIGAAVDRPSLGARPTPDQFTAKTTAMQRACSMASINPAQIDVAEIYDAYAGAQLQAIDALGLSDNVITDLRAGCFNLQGDLPVNLSGGLLGQGAPAGAIGVGQTATCALLLEGRYHNKLQPDKACHYALADTHGGIASNCAVTLLSAGDSSAGARA